MERTSDSGSGASLVMQYVETRTQGEVAIDDATPMLEQLLRRVAQFESQTAALQQAEKRAAELQRLIDVLKAQNEELQLTVRRLEIGFRRHVPEHVSPDQLKLVLAADAAKTSSQGPVADSSSIPDPETDPGTRLAAPPRPEDDAASDTPAPPSGSPKKNRHKHGRRRLSDIPKVIIETLPPEVLLKGLEAFERIGVEDATMLGHRRGGPVEVVIRRVKFIPREANADATSETSGESGADDTEGDDDADSSTAAVLLEHEVLTVPEDTCFKGNPFVDGAIVRYVPECSGAEPNGCSVLSAPLPERAFPRCMADTSLLAHILVGKLDYHLPYYRQEIESVRQGCAISRTNMARWQYECGGVALRIADAMWQDALACSWFGMDATGTAIQAKKEYRYGHVFVLVAPGDGVLFRFTPKYDADTVQELFGGSKATIVADASANHNVLFGPGKSREAGCWAHARKPFVKALRAGEGKDAAYALQTIQALFRNEEKFALLCPEARREARQRDSGPLVQALFEWVDKRLPAVKDDDSFVRKGLVYLNNQRIPLQEFLSNGEIAIHNNASERALRRIVKGRMNWLSHGSDEHARRACALSSLIASCELHGLDPEFYLQEVLTVAPSWPLSRILELSPKNWVATRQRLIAEGRLKYIDLATIVESRIASRVG